MASKSKPKRPGKTPEKAPQKRGRKVKKADIPEIAKSDVISAVPQDDENAPKLGRPSKYRKEFALVAAALCKRGATDMELAQEFGVNTSTIWRWSCQFDDFCTALRVGKESFDDRIERSVAQRAVGYSYNTEKVFNFQGVIVRADTIEHVPPDMGAAKMWLTNRRPDRWRDVQKHEMGGPGDFDQMSDAELNKYIQQEALNMGLARKAKPGSSH